MPDEAEATAARTMIERAREHHDLWPARLGADMAYGSAEMLDWRVHGRRDFSTPRTQAPPRDTLHYRASTADCRACAVKPRCCPNTPMRKVTRFIQDGAQDSARGIAETDADDRVRREQTAASASSGDLSSRLFQINQKLT